MALTLFRLGRWDVQLVDYDHAWRQRSGTRRRPLPRKGETTGGRSLCALLTWSWRFVCLSAIRECGTAATVIVGAERRREGLGRELAVPAS
jgi:hypothetical protein